VLAWELSNTLDTKFCVRVLKKAIQLHGVPEIFNTDQGCQFTSLEFTGVLLAHGELWGPGSYGVVRGAMGSGRYLLLFFDF